MNIVKKISIPQSGGHIPNHPSPPLPLYPTDIPTFSQKIGGKQGEGEREGRLIDWSLIKNQNRVGGGRIRHTLFWRYSKATVILSLSSLLVYRSGEESTFHALADTDLQQG